MKRLSLFAGFLALVAVLPLGASGPRPGFDQALSAEMARRHIPGMAVAVVRNGKTLKTGYYGFASLEHRVRVSAGTSFAIASMSKAFTDAAVLLLADEGKLSIDDPVSKYLPDAPATWSTITLRRLMNHTAGLVDDWDHDWDEVPGYFAVTQTDAGFLDGLYKTPLVFPPGTRLEYGAGPFVAGLIVARVSGKRYEAFMRERIFAPLGLKSTYINDPNGVHLDRASGYLWWNDQDAKKPWPWLLAGSPPRGSLTRGLQISAAAEARGDVSVASTADDMTRWLTGLTSRKLLSAAATDAMFGTTRLTNDDLEDGGFGWFGVADPGGTMQEHSGNFRTGYSSYITYHPHSGLGIVILTNLGNAANRSLAELIAAYFDNDHGPIADRPVDRSNPPVLRQISATFQAIAANRVDESAMVARFPMFEYDADAQKRFGGEPVLSSRGCDDVRERKDAVQGYPTASICYFEIGGASPGFGWATTTADGKVSYVGLSPR